MNLADFWAIVLALGLLLYIVLDGFDLGVGILFGLSRSEEVRRSMLSAVSPVWDGNETWLIVAGTVLFAAFPKVYSLLLSAFYLPLCLMLGALILRGVAFEFRHNASPVMRRVWDTGFAGGSFVAAFVQGATAGALVHGLPVDAAGRYAGAGTMAWLTPFAVACGIGLCMGDALLGACWLVLKGEGRLRSRGYRLIPWLMAGVILTLAAAWFYALDMHLRVLDRWLERPWLLVLPLLGLLTTAAMLVGVRKRRDGWPFTAAVLTFVIAFATLAASFLPYMVPYSITVAEAAAPQSSLSFIFWGAGIVVLPLTLIYTAVVYGVFKGKVEDDAYP